jgi:hypothetical protein
MWATVADAGGRCVVKVDGATVIDYTGDTKNGGTNSTIDTVELYRNQAGTNYYDDLYMNDTGLLGPCRIYTLAPTGAGSSTAMTPSTGANWSCVDEQPYSATDYVTGSSGQRDLYALGDLPGSPGTIHAVQVASVAKKSDAGALNLRNNIRSGGTTYQGASSALATTDGSIVDAWTTDPATSSAWTASGVNALEAGAEVV